jgi:hypothetical protein
MPTHDRVGFDEDEDVTPSGPPGRKRHPEEAVGPGQGRAGASAQENGELLAKRKVLDGQVGARLEGRPDGGEEGE